MVSLLSLVPVRLVDGPLFLALNGVHSPTTDSVWLAVTTAGDGLLLGIVLGAFLAINPRVTFLGLILICVSSLLVHLTKALYPSMRPASVFDCVHVIGPLLRSGSFPSGHAAAAMSTGLAIAFSYPPARQGGVAVTLAALIGISRVFVGAHFPVDVLAGFLLAAASYCVITGVLRQGWEGSIPDRPAFSRKGFRVAYWVEVITTLFALLVYAPFYSDYPDLVVVIALGVLMVLTIGWMENADHVGD